MLKDMMQLSNQYPYTKDTLRKINATTQYLSEKDHFEIELPIATVRKYYGDFSGLLNELGVPLILHQYIMKINNIPSSETHITDLPTIKLINEQKIKGLLSYTLD